MKDNKITLIPEEIQKTIGELYLRIYDRFPHSGLTRVCKSLHEISKETNSIVEWISRPNYPLRVIICSSILVVAGILIFSIAQLKIKTGGFSLTDFVQMTEAGLNELVIIGAGIFFLMTLENRRKRKRVINSINKLRCMAHLIDAHQLTKDPDGVAKISVPTAHSPKVNLNAYELGRYLDYCSEMLSLTSKLGFMYVQNFGDPVANSAVNELENLTNSLSRKIWQKIMILRSSNKS